MKIYLIYTVLVLFYLQQVQGGFGVDVGTYVQLQEFKCMKKTGIEYAILRGYHSYGAVDVNAIRGLKNAVDAGLIPCIYMNPCRGKDPIVQVNQIMESIPINDYYLAFVKVEANLSPGCSWVGYDYKSNCDFLISILQAFIAKGKSSIGVYVSSFYIWQATFGSLYACPDVGGLPLWYSNLNNEASFADFRKFGGWTVPAIKQFKVGNICGVIVNGNYSP